MKKWILFFCLCFSSSCFAFSWGSLWEHQDSAWKGVDHYRQKEYAKAAKHFADDHSADGFYNQGNALALAGKYQDAIHAYDQAIRLAKNPQDALYNKKIVEKFLKQKQSQNDKDSKKENNKQDQMNKKPKNQKGQGTNEKEQKSQDASSGATQKKAQGNHISQKNKNSPQQRFASQKEQKLLQRIPDDPGGLLRQKLLRDMRDS